MHVVAVNQTNTIQILILMLIQIQMQGNFSLTNSNTCLKYFTDTGLKTHTNTDINKLGCTSVKLHVWLEFQVLCDLINFGWWLTMLEIVGDHSLGAG